MNESVETLIHWSRSLDEGNVDVWRIIPPERRWLTRLKHLSLRNKSWFTLLSRSERGFIDAIIMTLDRIRSFLILRLLSPLVRRMLRALSRDLDNGGLGLIRLGAYRMMKDVAERIVGIAQKWGNKSAKEWLDQKFLGYLVIMSLPQNKNAPSLTG